MMVHFFGDFHGYIQQLDPCGMSELMRGTVIRRAFIPAVLAVSLAVSCSQAPEPGPGPKRSGNQGQDRTQASAEPSDRPEEVAEAFFEAANEKDEERFASLLTEEARGFLNQESGFSLSEGSFESYVIGNSTISGSTAEVTAEAIQDGNEQDLVLRMRQDGGAWRVYAVKVTTADGVSMEIDFEKMGSMMEAVAESMGDALQEGFEQAALDARQGGSDEEIREKRVRFEHLRPMSEEEMEQAWRVSEEMGDTTALEAIQRLAEPLGLTVFPGDHAGALAKVVSADVAGQSRLEAIETVCAEVGLYPVYPSPQTLSGFAGAMVEALADGMSTMLLSEDSAIAINVSGVNNEGVTAGEESEAPPANAIQFQAGPRPYPVAFTGPFLITVDEVEENVPHATGEVYVAARGYGIDPGVLMLLSDYGETSVFERVENDDGESLKADENVRYYGGGYIAGTSYTDRTGIDLKGLLRDVESIHVIAGIQRLVRPAAVHAVEFSTLREGVSQRVGDWRVTVKRTGKNTEFEIRGPEEQLDDLMVQFRAEDAAGEEMGIQFHSSAQWGQDKVQASLQTPESPGLVEMKLVTAEVLEYPFELTNIPLAHHAEMPAEIEGLSFGEHEKPAAVEFVRFTDRENPDFPKVLVRARNFANKDALTIHVTFTYLDRQGKALKDFPHTLMGTFSAAGHSPVVEEGQTAEVETTAFFMPEETAGLEVTVEKVEFIDGTEWEL